MYARELWSDLGVKLPCVVLSKAPMPEIWSALTSAKNKVGYPCMAVVIVPSNQDRELSEGPTKWRQQIETMFDKQKPPRLVNALHPSVNLIETEWHPLDAVDLESFNKNLIVSAAVIIVTVTKAR